MLMIPRTKKLTLIFLAAAVAAASTTVTFESAAQVPVKAQPAPPRLIAGLKNPDAATRRQAANELGYLRSHDAVKQLTQALLDRDAGVREAAAFALGQITDRQAMGPLLNALTDKDSEVRASAAFALGMLGDRRAIKALSNALGESAVEVRSSAATALGLIEDDDAVEEIIAMLDDPSIDVRYDAVWALGQIRAPDSTDHLHAALVNLDLLKIDDSLLEAYRQAVQHSIARLQALDQSLSGPGRPRRSTGPRKPPPFDEQARERANLTRSWSIRQSVQPAPTERALRARVTGTVGLRVLVGVEGRAVRAYVIRRLGYGLDQRAVQAILQYSFDPEIIRGLPQTVWKDLEVKF